MSSANTGSVQARAYDAAGEIVTNEQFNLADVFEAVVDAVPDRPAVALGDETLWTFAETDRAANQVGHLCTHVGITQGEHVALYLMNSMEHVAALIGLVKMGAVPINVNYRYTPAELEYLFLDADVTSVIVEEAEHQDVLAGRLPQLLDVRRVLVIGDVTPALAHACADQGVAVHHFAEYAKASAERGFGKRSGDQQFIIYTGGTTGMPKGVVWRHHDFFMRPLSGGNPYGDARRSLTEVAQAATETDPLTTLTAAPLMHGASLFTLWTFFTRGMLSVLMRSFNPEQMTRLIQTRRANLILIVGDGMGAPLADAMERLSGEVDLSSLRSITSGGALWSSGVRNRLLAIKPDLYLRDNFGASESGNDGTLTMAADGSLRLPPTPSVLVVHPDLSLVEPGSDDVGSIVRVGNVPLGYYNDPEKSARTFITLPDGRRGSMLGDMGRVEADGSILFLGRGSGCINTGGEKVFPEEVEGVLHDHPAVADALVVGVTDERLGSRVAAVASLREGAQPPTLAQLQEHCRKFLAGYKVPRELVVVDVVRRNPAGKADYRWAKNQFPEGGS